VPTGSVPLSKYSSIRASLPSHHFNQRFMAFRRFRHVAGISILALPSPSAWGVGACTRSMAPEMRRRRAGRTGMAVRPKDCTERAEAGTSRSS
jgi:hypothetical protein